MNPQPCLPGFERHRRPPRLTVAEIQREVASYFRVALPDLLSARRTRDVARPRQVAMYLAKLRTPQSVPDIGRRFGRDHTTVLHAVKQVERLIGLDCSLALAVRELDGRL